MTTARISLTANACKALSLTVLLCTAGANIALAQPVPAGTPKDDPWDDTQVIAAGQVGGERNSYGTVGVVHALPGSKLGDGWVARVFADEVTYKYNGTGNRSVDATGFGGSASVGYMGSGPQGWYGVYAGPAYKHVHESPVDPNSDARGGTISARVQAEGDLNTSQDTKINALAGTDISSNTGYWARVRPMVRVAGDIYAGPEGAVMGDQDYHAYQAGVAVVGIHLTDKTQVGINGGYRKTKDQAGTGYGGVELGSRF